jgi:hypothetical protein
VWFSDLTATKKKKEEVPIEFPPEKGKEAEGPKYKLHMNERRRRRTWWATATFL